MKSLARAVLHESVGASAINTPWATMNDNRLLIRREETTLVAAPAGAGKTIWALCVANANKSLYLCADTSWRTVAVRVATMLANDPDTSMSGKPEGGWKQHLIEEALAESPEWGADLLAKADHMAFAFPSGPTPDDIMDTLDAYWETHGEYPELVIIDNLFDVDAGNEDEWANMRRAMAEMQKIARATGCAIVVLHHTSETIKSLSHPQPRADIQGKIARTSNLVLTLLQDRVAKQLLLAPVKSRDIADDPSGQTFFALDADFNHMRITDPKPTAAF